MLSADEYASELISSAKKNSAVAPMHVHIDRDVMWLLPRINTGCVMLRAADAIIRRYDSVAACELRDAPRPLSDVPLFSISSRRTASACERESGVEAESVSVFFCHALEL